MLVLILTLAGGVKVSAISQSWAESPRWCGTIDPQSGEAPRLGHVAPPVARLQAWLSVAKGSTDEQTPLLRLCPSFEGPCGDPLVGRHQAPSATTYVCYGAVTKQ